jgi:hypothetical protein
LKVFSGHQAESPSFPEDATQSGKVAVRRRRAEPLGEQGSHCLGVLVAQVVPRQSLGIEAIAREQGRHRVQSRHLASPRPL